MNSSVQINYSNKGLRFWEAGCTWSDGSIQLRKVFEKKRVWLLYSRDEIIAHEQVHAKRLHLEEPVFEEILAYRTSKSRFRRYWGPIFRTPKESLLFALTLLFPPFIPWALLPILGLVAFGMMRLIRLQRIFSKAEAKVGKEIVNLKDKEIFALAN